MIVPRSPDSLDSRRVTTTAACWAMSAMIPAPPRAPIRRASSAGIRSPGRHRQPVRIAGTISGTDSTTTPSVVPQPSTRIASSLTRDGATWPSTIEPYQR